MSLRAEAIALLCAVEPWPYSEVDTRHAIELHPDGPVAHQVARVEARLSDLLRRQREACAVALAMYGGAEEDEARDIVARAKAGPNPYYATAAILGAEVA